MKKTIFRKLVLAAMVFLGVGSANAQKGYTVPPLDPELQELADEVVKNQLSDPDKANKSFVKLLRKIRTDKEELLSVGQYFFDHENFAAATLCARNLYQEAPTYIDGLMFCGEVYIKRKQFGTAGQRYDEVLRQDSTNVPALKRIAFVYKNVNPYVAVEKLERIKVIQPDSFFAYKELGDIAYNMSDYKKAVAEYDNYYAKAPKSELSIRSCENYLMSLFSVQKIDKVGKVVSELEDMAPKSLMLQRMKFFSSVDIARNSIHYEEDMAKAAENMKYLTEKRFNDSLYLYLDYAYAADFTSERGDVDGAIKLMEQALQKDTTKVAGYKTMARLYSRGKQFDKAIPTYKHFVKLVGKKLRTADLFVFGGIYLQASRQDSISDELKKQYVASADSVYEAVLTIDPNAYQAVLSRARLNITDPQNPEEKPTELYKKALEMMEGREKTDAAKFEAATYLAFRGIKLDLLDEARKYTDIMLSIKPDHKQAVTFDKYLKSSGK